MSAKGFMIPLDYNDWKDYGDRTGWCSKQSWWTNQNISLAGSSLGPTQARVGDVLTVQVGIQGVNAPGADVGTAEVQSVQAWACYPSPTAGATSASLLLPSMKASNPSITPGSLFVNGAIPNPGSYQLSGPTLPAPYALVSLDGTWTPTTADLIPPNTEVHCCLIATCAGADLDGSPLGTKVPSDSALATSIDICTSPYQGQCNIMIFSMPIHQKSLEIGFLAAGLNAVPGEVLVDVSQLQQANGVDPAVLRGIRRGPFGGPQPAPATSGLKTLRVARNTHRLTPALSQIVRPAEKIVESGAGLRLSLPSQGIQPLLLQVEVDATATPGTVYAFDITQTGANGKRGGIRVGAIVVE